MPSKKIHELKFPVYRLRDHGSIYTNPLGLKVVEGWKKDWILDDTNMEDPYPIRRIKMASQGRDVYPLSDMYESYSRMVHNPSGTTFIDSDGYIFKYKKSKKYWKLDYFEIMSMELTEEYPFTIVRVHGVDIPFIFYTILNTSMQYMGLLHSDGMYLPYDFSVYKKKSTRRRL